MLKKGKDLDSGVPESIQEILGSPQIEFIPDPLQPKTDYCG